MALKFAKNRTYISEPRLVVFGEKYGAHYYLVKNDAQLFKLALRIVEERLENAWYYDDEPVTPLDFTEADIENMPKSLQASAIQKLKDWRRELNNTCRDKTEAETILRNKDGEAAYNFLDGRRDHKYEGFEIEKFEEIL